MDMKRILRLLFLYVPLGLVLLSLLWAMLYRVVPVTWTPLMLKRSIENVDSEGFRNRRVWVRNKNYFQLIYFRELIFL